MAIINLYIPDKVLIRFMTKVPSEKRKEIKKAASQLIVNKVNESY